MSKQRIYASLLILGSGILLFRTIHMLANNAFDYLCFSLFMIKKAIDAFQLHINEIDNEKLQNRKQVINFASDQFQVFNNDYYYKSYY